MQECLVAATCADLNLWAVGAGPGRPGAPAAR